jgi:hypothetical protein
LEEFKKQYDDVCKKQSINNKLFYTTTHNGACATMNGSGLFHHCSLFLQILCGALLGDGWLENTNGKVRFGIAQSAVYKDIVQVYYDMLWLLGYIKKYKPLALLERNKQSKKVKYKVNYYQIRTTRTINLDFFYNQWYLLISGEFIKTVPFYFVQTNLTPFSLALWIMGDGSGMKDGGFKLASHSFDLVCNCFLAYLLDTNFGLTCSVHADGKCYYIRVWKRSVSKLFNIVKPFISDSTLYKFKYVKL